MDKAEYQSRLEELNRLVKNGDYKNALEIVEEIDWRRVKSIRTLTMVADVYDQNKMYEEEQNILLIAYDRSTLGKALLYRLTEVSVRMQDFDSAKEFYNEFIKVASHDISRHILKYEILKGTGEPLDKQIEVLEEYTQLEFEEKWAYELAILYSKNGEKDKCLRTCDDLILWFNEGRYVIKALKLKKKYNAITPSQERKLEVLLGENLRAKEAKRNAEAANRVVLNSTDSIQQNVAQDLRIVLPSRPKMEDDLLPTKEAPAEYIDPTEYAVRDLEPENLSIQVNPSPDARETIKTTPVKKPKEYEELDLEALFAETASGLSEEVQTTMTPAAPIVEEETEEKPEEEAAEEEDTFSLEDVLVAALEEESKEPEEEEDTFSLEDVLVAALEAGSQESEEAEPEASVVEETEAEEPVVEETEAEELPVEDTETEELPVEEAESEELPVEDTETEELPVEEAESKELPVEEAETEENIPIYVTGPGPMPEGEEEAVFVTSAFKDPLEEARFQANMEQVEGDLVWEEEAANPTSPYAEALALSPEQMNIEIPAEPRKEEVTDATITFPDPREIRITDRPEMPKIPNEDGIIPMSVEEVLREETEEERRLRILNEERSDKLTDDQKILFTYFMKVPGMEQQIVDALNHLYDHAGERTSHAGNIAVMGGYGTGKSRMFESFVRTICTDLKLPAVKIARIDAADLNKKDPAQVVAKMSGGFLLIERAGLMYPEIINKLSQAMDFRTDRMILVIEDEKVSMRGLLHNYPDFAEKFGTVVSIPVFTNDELVTFARTYARENGYRMDELGVLALYTKIGENQKEGEPMTISGVKEMVDGAIRHAGRGSRKFGRKLSRRHVDAENHIILYEKDFE